MSNSISTTVVEVTKNIHGLMTANVKANHMTVMMVWFMSRCHNKDGNTLFYDPQTTV